MASKPRLWNLCPRIAPPRIIAKARFPRSANSATYLTQPRRSKTGNSQPYRRPQTQIGGLPFQNRAFAATRKPQGGRETRSPALKAKALRNHAAARKGRSAASGTSRAQSPQRPRTRRPERMSRAERGKGVRHQRRQSAADEPISSFTHPSGRRREKRKGVDIEADEYGSRAPSASSAPPHRLSRNTHKPPCASAVPPRPHSASPTQCCRLVAVLTGKTLPGSRAARTKATASSSEPTIRHSTHIPPDPTPPCRPLLHQQYAAKFAFNRTSEVSLICASPNQASLSQAADLH